MPLENHFIEFEYQAKNNKFFTLEEARQVTLTDLREIRAHAATGRIELIT